MKFRYDNDFDRMFEEAVEALEKEAEAQETKGE